MLLCLLTLLDLITLVHVYCMHATPVAVVTSRLLPSLRSKFYARQVHLVPIEVWLGRSMSRPGNINGRAQAIWG
jgi:hypothetical protein